MLFFVPVLIGLGVIVAFQLAGAGAKANEIRESATPVRTVRVGDMAIVPRSKALGVVQAPATWTGVAQVSGEVVYRSPNAEEGRTVSEGEVLFRVDAEEYEIAVRQIEAAGSENQARIENLDASEASTRRLLEIERESLVLLETNYDRMQESFSAEAATPRELDDARREYLSQLARVTDLENALSGYPSDRAALEASQAANRADLENARLALSRTEIVSPIRGRVTEVVVEQNEFVSTGQGLLTVSDVSKAEIVANCSPAELRNVLLPSERSDSPAGLRALQELLASREITAIVRLPLVEPGVSWDGVLDRLGASFEPRGRTLPVYVLVDDPYGQAVPGKKPPLIEEMFCEVELRADPLSGFALIPRTAFHSGLVHLVKDGRLATQRVSVAFRVGDFLAVKGLDAGSAVVVSDLPFVIENMLLETTNDESLETRIEAIARGEGRLR